MSYRISWEGTSYDDINTILASGPWGRELMQAVKSIRTELETDPLASGREMAEGLYLIDAGRFRFYYSIEPDAGLIKVGALRLLKT
jgi:hypothetical protein